MVGETNDERAETTHHWGCVRIDSLGATLLINCDARWWPRYFTWSQTTTIEHYAKWIFSVTHFAHLVTSIKFILLERAKRVLLQFVC